MAAKRTPKPSRKVSRIPCRLTFSAGVDAPRPTSMNPPAEVCVQSDGDGLLHIVTKQGDAGSVTSLSSEDALLLARLLVFGVGEIDKAKFYAARALEKAGAPQTTTPRG